MFYYYSVISSKGVVSERIVELKVVLRGDLAGGKEGETWHAAFSKFGPSFSP